MAQASCPKCGNSHDTRETDTCDTFVNNSWYYLRYATDPSTDKPFDADFWNRHRVSLYLRGPEHMQGNLLTPRMIYHFLRCYGYIGNVFSEPYGKFLMQGIINAKMYKD